MNAIYDEVRNAFLSLGTKRADAYLDAEVLARMWPNFRQDEIGFHPRECDVLTAYIPIELGPFSRLLAHAAREFVSLFPRDFPHYAVPAQHYHISLVTFNDMRPADLDAGKLPPEPDLNTVANLFRKAIREASTGPYELSPYGLVCSPVDGSVLAVFTDMGQTLTLRNCIGDELRGCDNVKVGEYKKPFIHVTLLRPLTQYTIELLNAVQEVQEQISRQIESAPNVVVNGITLAREHQWMHAELSEIAQVELMSEAVGR